jgi:phosphatidylinositol-3-phosphatase
MRSTAAIARVSLIAALVCGVAGLSACGGSGSGETQRAAEQACGRVPPGSPTYRHVVWIWMENKDYANVIGSSSAPFLNSLAADCGLATNYHAITNPSLPNYIAATSGLGGYKLNPFYSNCQPDSYCSTRLKSVFAQLRSWRAYQESMPRPCARRDDGLYAARHNPAIYYRSLRGCRKRDLPLTALQRDLDGNSLPAFSFITPNLCHDAHSCPLKDGDDWLAEEVPRIIQSAAYRAGNTVLVITFDEGEESSHIATVIVSPSTPAGRRSGARFDHYSLLRTTQELLGVPRLGRAKAARSMAGSFGL